jgi:hypothetical protein
VISADGHADVTRTVAIVQGTNLPLDVALGAPGGSRSKLPLAIMGGGAALLVTGVILYATSETDTGEKFEYRDTKPLGVGLMVGGLAAAGVGAYLWFVKKQPADSAPVDRRRPGHTPRRGLHEDEREVLRDPRRSRALPGARCAGRHHLR